MPTANLPNTEKSQFHTWLVCSKIFLFFTSIWVRIPSLTDAFPKGLVQPPTRYSPCLPCHPPGVLNAPRSPPPPLPPPPPPAPIEVPMEVAFFSWQMMLTYEHPIESPTEQMGKFNKSNKSIRKDEIIWSTLGADITAGPCFWVHEFGTCWPGFVDHGNLMIYGKTVFFFGKNIQRSFAWISSSQTHEP